MCPDDGCYLVTKYGESVEYLDISDEVWAAIFEESRTEAAYREGQAKGHARVEPRQIPDRDPAPQMAQPLPPMEHGPNPLLDASED